MTVAELIVKLQTMPQEALVIYQRCSECVALEEDEVLLFDDYIERNGIYMQFKDKWWDYSKDGDPKKLTVCVFPGN